MHSSVRGVMRPYVRASTCARSVVSFYDITFSYHVNVHLNLRLLNCILRPYDNTTKRHSYLSVDLLSHDYYRSSRDDDIFCK